MKDNRKNRKRLKMQLRHGDGMHFWIDLGIGKSESCTIIHYDHEVKGIANKAITYEDLKGVIETMRKDNDLRQNDNLDKDDLTANLKIIALPQKSTFPFLLGQIEP